MEWPQPRVPLGLALRGIATAAIDLSDGLSGDLGHVLRASGVGATLRIDDIPHGPHVQACAEPLRRTCLLSGGDDYELLFCAAPADRARVHDAGERVGVAVARIGAIDAEPGLRVVDGAGRRIEHDERAFDHFIAS
jgi:thiamine-monophosphate kinase